MASPLLSRSIATGSSERKPRSRATTAAPRPASVLRSAGVHPSLPSRSLAAIASFSSNSGSVSRITSLFTSWISRLIGAGIIGPEPGSPNTASWLPSAETAGSRGTLPANATAGAPDASSAAAWSNASPAVGAALPLPLPVAVAAEPEPAGAAGGCLHATIAHTTDATTPVLIVRAYRARTKLWRLSGGIPRGSFVVPAW